MHPMEDTLIAPDPVTGAFAPKLCQCCSELPTQHRCLATVTTGGVLYGVSGGRVCGSAVCSPCSFKFGNEGVIRFASITAALASNPCIKAATKRKPSISPDNGTELFSPDPNIYTLETPNERESRPIGNKASKRRQEEEKILESVTSKLKDGLHNNNSGGAGFAIAKAIGDFTNILAMTLQQWNDRQSYDNSNPELKKRYDELLIMEKVHQMEEAQRRREALQQHHNQEIQRSTEDADKDD